MLNRKQLQVCKAESTELWDFSLIDVINLPFIIFIVRVCFSSFFLSMIDILSLPNASPID